MTLYTMNEKRILISVCIATYKREKLLERLLQSLTEQVLEQNIMIEIIVTDNNIEESAKSILRKFISTDKISFKYFIQPIKNISLTRNVCVENATGHYICFIDDDETADKNWIVNLLDCVQKFNADGVFGYVIPRFEEGINDKFKQREFYFSKMSESGSHARFMFTTNALVKSEIIKKNNVLFDPDYGITGGEDANFFGKLKKEGAKFVNCKEAISYEFIGKQRTTIKFFLRRNIRGGQTYSRNFITDAKQFQKVQLFIKSLLKLLIGILLFIPSLVYVKARINSLKLLGSGIGEILGLIGKPKDIH